MPTTVATSIPAKVAVEAYLAGTLAPRADFKCKRTGYTADTLRFYEKAGLLPGVRRKGGRRVYTDEDY